LFVLLRLFWCQFFERFNNYLQHLTIHTHYIFSTRLETTKLVFKGTGQKQRRLNQRFCRWSAFGTIDDYEVQQNCPHTFAVHQKHIRLFLTFVSNGAHRVFHRVSCKENHTKILCLLKIIFISSVGVRQA